MRGLRIAVWGTTQIVSPRGQNAGVFKDNGNVCIRCLERILSGVGSRKFGLAEQNWSKISYGSKLQGLGVCGVWPGSKSLLSP